MEVLLYVFLSPDTKNGNRDTKIHFKRPRERVGYWAFGRFIFLSLKKKDHRVYWRTRSVYGLGIATYIKCLAGGCHIVGVQNGSFCVIKDLHPCFFFFFCIHGFDFVLFCALP